MTAEMGDVDKMTHGEVGEVMGESVRKSVHGITDKFPRALRAISSFGKIW